MKRKLFATSAVAIAALLVLGSGRLVSNRQVAENSLDENMFDLNVEALADGEGSGSYSICYSESRVTKGYTYIDCSTCQKVYDEKGKGDYSKCFY